MAITADRNAKFGKFTSHGFKVTASTTIYAGDLVMVTSGYAVPADDTASSLFVGVAKEQVDNSSGADGDETVDCYLSGVVSCVAVGAAQATWVGQKVFANGDATVALTGSVSNSVYVGVCVEVVSATEVRVAIDTLSSD